MELEEAKKQPHIEIARMRPLTHILIETRLSLISIVVTEPRTLAIEVTGSDLFFKIKRKPQMGSYHEAWSELDGGVVVPGWIIKDMRMTLNIPEGLYVTEPAVSALVEGKGWKYDVF